jgi:hypothetical protein
MLVERRICREVLHQGVGRSDVDRLPATGTPVKLPCDGVRKAHDVTIVSFSFDTLAAVWDVFHPNILRLINRVGSGAEQRLRTITLLAGPPRFRLVEGGKESSRWSPNQGGPCQGGVAVLLAASNMVLALGGAAATILWIIAVILVIAGIVTLLRGGVLMGIVLIVVGLLVGPGGVSIFK